MQKNKNDTQDTLFEEDIAVHIFSASATMLGVCLTVIGIIHIIINGKSVETLADDFLAIASLAFLFSCGLSYWVLRTRHFRRMLKVEKLADVIFIGGLCIMAAVSFMITYWLI